MGRGLEVEGRGEKEVGLGVRGKGRVVRDEG